MSGAAHTPGKVRYVPWHVEEGAPAIRTADGWLLCATSSDADAERIADCWNACEGIADPSVVPELVAAARGLASDVQDMIDCRGDCGEWGSECPLQDAHKPDSTIERLQRLLDALAKIGGDV